MPSGACAGLAEWQTRGTQNALPARACGFESHIRHVNWGRIGAVAAVLAIAAALAGCFPDTGEDAGERMLEWIRDREHVLDAQGAVRGTFDTRFEGRIEFEPDIADDDMARLAREIEAEVRGRGWSEVHLSFGLGPDYGFSNAHDAALPALLELRADPDYSQAWMRYGRDDIPGASYVATTGRIDEIEAVYAEIVALLRSHGETQPNVSIHVRDPGEILNVQGELATAPDLGVAAYRRLTAAVPVHRAWVIAYGHGTTAVMVEVAPDDVAAAESAIAAIVADPGFQGVEFELRTP